MNRQIYTRPLPEGRVLVLELAGSVGIDNSELTAYLELNEAEWDRINGIILDCAGLEFVTSTSVGPVVMLHIRSCQRNRSSCS